MLTGEEFKIAADLYIDYEKLKRVFESGAKKIADLGGTKLTCMDESAFLTAMAPKIENTFHGRHERDDPRERLKSLFQEHARETPKQGTLMTFRRMFRAIAAESGLRDALTRGLELSKPPEENKALQMLFGEEPFSGRIMTRNAIKVRKRRKRHNLEKIEDWDPQEVADYFTTLDREPLKCLRQHAPKFARERVSGALLMDPTFDEDLIKEMGITKPGDIECLMEHIEQLATDERRLVIKVYDCVRHTTPGTREVTNTMTVGEFREKCKIPRHCDILAQGRVIEDSEVLRSIYKSCDIAPMYVITHPIDQWSSHEVSVWIKAHRDLAEYEMNFRSLQIDGHKLQEINMDIVRRFVDGRKRRITVGKAKDLIEKIRRKVERWKKFEETQDNSWFSFDGILPRC